MIKSYGKYILAVIGAAYFGLLIQVLVTIPLRLMFASDPNLRNTLACVCCVLGSMVMLFFVTVKFGCDEQKPDKPLLDKNTMLPCVAAVVVYDLLTVIFRYYTGAATNVATLARVFGGLDEQAVDIKELAAEHGGLMFLSLVIQTLPFIIPMLTGYYVGAKKRRGERQKLHAESR